MKTDKHNRMCVEIGEFKVPYDLVTVMKDPNHRKPRYTIFIPGVLYTSLTNYFVGLTGHECDEYVYQNTLNQVCIKQERKHIGFEDLDGKIWHVYINRFKVYPKYKTQKYYFGCLDIGEWANCSNTLKRFWEFHFNKKVALALRRVKNLGIDYGRDEDQ